MIKENHNGTFDVYVNFGVGSKKEGSYSNIQLPPTPNDSSTDGEWEAWEKAYDLKYRVDLDD